MSQSNPYDILTNAPNLSLIFNAAHHAPPPASLHPLYSSKPKYIDFNKSFYHFSLHFQSNFRERHIMTLASVLDLRHIIPKELLLRIHAEGTGEESDDASRQIAVIHSALGTRLPFWRDERVASGIGSEALLWRMSRMLREALAYVEYNTANIQFISTTAKSKTPSSDESCPYLKVWKDTVWIQCAPNVTPQQVRRNGIDAPHINVLFVDLLDSKKKSTQAHYGQNSPFNSLQERIQHLMRMQNTNDEQHNPLLQWILHKSNIQVIVSCNTHVIHPEVEATLRKNDVYCISGVTKPIFDKLRSLFGGTSVRSMQSIMETYPNGVGNNIVQNSTTPSSSLLGHAQHITIERLATQHYYVFHHPPRRRVLTLIVHVSHSQDLKNLVMSSVNSALNCVNFAIKDGAVIPGAGVFEMMFASYLRKQAPKLEFSKHQSMYLALSRSLEAIPMGILSAYYMPVNELMDLWREKVDMQVEEMLHQRAFTFPVPHFAAMVRGDTRMGNNHTSSIAQFVNLLDLRPEEQIFDVVRLKVTAFHGGIKLVQKINQIQHVIRMQAPAVQGGTPHGETLQGEEEEQIESSNQERRAIADVYQRHSSRFPKNQQWIQHARSLELKSHR